jgi:threonine/homoserine/homoserine lactone efflux protein
VLKYLLLGSGFAFAAAIQPGPLQAFLLSRVAATGWRRTLPACLAPLLSDGPIALLALLVLGQLPPPFQRILRGGGGLLLLYLAWVAFRQWRNPAEPGSHGSAPRTMLEAALVNLLNPNPYLGWALVLGPLTVSAWHEHWAYAVALVAAFYGTMVAMLAAFILLVGTARFLGPRGQHALLGVSAVVLAGIGVYLLVSALSGPSGAGAR